MTPGRLRFSRAAAMALTLVLVLAAVVTVHRLNQIRAEQRRQAQRQEAPAPAVPAPTTLPATTQPAPSHAGAEPATRPAALALIPPGLAAVEQPQRSSRAMEEAQTLHAAGNLVAARRVLNDALNAGKLSPADAASARRLISDINQIVIFSPRRFAEDPFQTTHQVRTGDRLAKIAPQHEVTWELLCRINGISDPGRLRVGQVLKIIRGPFHAVVTKSTYTLDVYLGAPGEAGAMFVTSYPVGLGRDESTPTGTWIVEPHKKLKNPTYYSPRGEGVIEADDPRNPLGERWIGLAGMDGQAAGQASYGIHGTIEPQSIGRQESMGCIRLLNADVEVLYDLMVEGKSTVIVKP